MCASECVCVCVTIVSPVCAVANHIPASAVFVCFFLLPKLLHQHSPRTVTRRPPTLRTHSPPAQKHFGAHALQVIIDDVVLSQAPRALRVHPGHVMVDLRSMQLDELLDMAKLIVEFAPSLGTLLVRGPELIALLEAMMLVRACVGGRAVVMAGVLWWSFAPLLFALLSQCLRVLFVATFGDICAIRFSVFL